MLLGLLRLSLMVVLRVVRRLFRFVSLVRWRVLLVLVSCLMIRDFLTWLFLLRVRRLSGLV